ncbi:hypothetical protein AHF37_10414 [Paragonimus kellicotti]|nr:hypothetical protein AHF37_10414 [Paragonimus kellicotti]
MVTKAGLYDPTTSHCQRTVLFRLRPTRSQRNLSQRRLPLPGAKGERLLINCQKYFAIRLRSSVVESEVFEENRNSSKA